MHGGWADLRVMIKSGRSKAEELIMDRETGAEDVMHTGSLPIRYSGVQKDQNATSKYDGWGEGSRSSQEESPPEGCWG